MNKVDLRGLARISDASLSESIASVLMRWVCIGGTPALPEVYYAEVNETRDTVLGHSVYVTQKVSTWNPCARGNVAQVGVCEAKIRALGLERQYNDILLSMTKTGNAMEVLNLTNRARCEAIYAVALEEFHDEAMNQHVDEGGDALDVVVMKYFKLEEELSRLASANMSLQAELRLLRAGGVVEE